MSTRHAKVRALQATDKQLAFVDHFGGEMIVQMQEQLLVTEHFRRPQFAIEGLELLELLLLKIEPAPFDILVPRRPADRRLASERATAYPIHDPLQHTHVVAETGPQEFPVRALAEPVDMENPRGLAQR